MGFAPTIDIDMSVPGHTHSFPGSPEVTIDFEIPIPMKWDSITGTFVNFDSTNSATSEIPMTINLGNVNPANQIQIIFPNILGDIDEVEISNPNFGEIENIDVTNGILAFTLSDLR